MAKKRRKVIGIIFNTDPNWMGGVIYILNCIKTLNWLPEDEKPRIILFYRKELNSFVKELKYPYLTTIEYKFPSSNYTFISSLLTFQNTLVNSLRRFTEIDAFFPVLDFPLKNKKGPKLISWYADLQHKHYPGFFSRKKRIERNLRIKFILRNCTDLVLSSRAVQSDFERFFGKSKINYHIYHFASVIDSFNFSGFEKIKNEKGLPDHYFLVSNQFYVHKNHKLVFEALIELKNSGIKPFIVFTGKLPDKSDSSYMRAMSRIIEEEKLDDQIIFLGVLSRQEQLKLMRNAQAVIQPSLYEGWSTVIEDAISLQTPVIASNIQVNVEQLGKNAIYFDSNIPQSLAKAILDFPVRTNFDEVIYQSYDTRIKIAAESFIKIFN